MEMCFFYNCNGRISFYYDVISIFSGHIYFVLMYICTFAYLGMESLVQGMRKSGKVRKAKTTDPSGANSSTGGRRQWTKQEDAKLVDGFVELFNSGIYMDM